MKNFALTGIAGFIASRHLKAIKETGNRLVCATDPHDSVGLLDSYFENVSYFPEFERFDRHLEKLRRLGENERVHFLSICSPNYLHDAHIRLALRIGADAICEKPVVLNPWNIDALAELEKESNNRIYTILQLRLHPTIIALKKAFESRKIAKKTEIVLTYVTVRGKWYLSSWKGVKEKSGGLATNIGIHFFDMLIWIFGSVLKSEVHVSSSSQYAGFIELERANVRWFLSIDAKDLPFQMVPGKKTTFRSINVDGQEVEFSEGFADLHTESYRKILCGEGFGISDSRPSIEFCQQVRNAVLVNNPNYSHPKII